jgi:hypothetical protein
MMEDYPEPHEFTAEEIWCLLGIVAMIVIGACLS